MLVPWHRPGRDRSARAFQAEKEQEAQVPEAEKYDPFLPSAIITGRQEPSMHRVVRV